MILDQARRGQTDGVTVKGTTRKCQNLISLLVSFVVALSPVRCRDFPAAEPIGLTPFDFGRDTGGFFCVSSSFRVHRHILFWHFESSSELMSSPAAILIGGTGKSFSLIWGGYLLFRQGDYYATVCTTTWILLVGMNSRPNEMGFRVQTLEQEEK